MQVLVVDSASATVEDVKTSGCEWT